MQKFAEGGYRVTSNSSAMENEIILDDWNPSEETLRHWAYHEHVQLADQDADLVLHREDFLPVLLELADDPACPRSSEILSTLDFYLMFLVLRGSDEHVEVVKKAVVISGGAKTAQVIAWRQLQERRLQHRAGAGPLTREQALAAAQDLMLGISRVAELTLVGDHPNEWVIELSVPPTNRHRERLLFEKNSGRFQFSR
jgi:hypothetical protein